MTNLFCILGTVYKYKNSQVISSQANSISDKVKELMDFASKFSSKYKRYVQILQLSEDIENKFYWICIVKFIRD